MWGKVFEMPKNILRPCYILLGKQDYEVDSHARERSTEISESSHEYLSIWAVFRTRTQKKSEGSKKTYHMLWST